MRVQLLRRWGVHKPGATVLVDDRQGEWLVSRGFGVEAPVMAPAPASARAAKAAAVAGAGAASTAGAEVKPRARRAPTRRARKATAAEGGSGDEQ